MSARRWWRFSVSFPAAETPRSKAVTAGWASGKFSAAPDQRDTPWRRQTASMALGLVEDSL
jgi:hypothetical protein